MIIDSGVGNGARAGVTTSNQLLTRAISSNMIFEASQDGRAFIITTDFISLTTTASYNGILYFVSTFPETHLHSLRFCSTVSTQWHVRKDVTTGTLVTSGTNITPSNMNFGSGSVFEGTAKKGANALTITDGDIIACGVSGTYSGLIFHLDEALILPPNISVAVEAKPSASGEVSVTAVFHKHEIAGTL